MAEESAFSTASEPMNEHITWTIQAKDEQQELQWELTCFSMAEVTELMEDAVKEKLACTVTQCPF